MQPLLCWNYFYIIAGSKAFGKKEEYTIHTRKRQNIILKYDRLLWSMYYSNVNIVTNSRASQFHQRLQLCKSKIYLCTEEFACWSRLDLNQTQISGTADRVITLFAFRCNPHYPANWFLFVCLLLLYGCSLMKT